MDPRESETLLESVSCLSISDEAINRSVSGIVDCKQMVCVKLAMPSSLTRYSDKSCPSSSSLKLPVTGRWPRRFLSFACALLLCVRRCMFIGFGTGTTALCLSQVHPKQAFQGIPLLLLVSSDESRCATMLHWLAWRVPLYCCHGKLPHVAEFSS